MSPALQTITLGGGCFWCTEAVFDRVRGVTDVQSGYANGDLAAPSYEQVCTGATGHAEVVRVTFDPAQIGLREILEIFFATHDPTTQDRQGNDVGRQYASVVFYTDEAQQKPTIDRVIGELRDEQGIKVVTEVHPAAQFFVAEDYHQDYYANNPTQSYCNFVIPPKLAKLKQYFSGFMIEQ